MPYSSRDMDEYPLSFISKLDSTLVKEISLNLDLYLKNSSEVLLNVNYPSRTEKEFLRHIEMWQQEKNDINYRIILQQLQES